MLARTASLLLVLTGCASEYALQLSIDDEAASNAATRFQLAVVQDCSDQALPGEPVGVVRTVEFARGESAPSVGDVDPGAYGLYGRAVDPDCQVVASGCTPVILEKRGSGTLSVQLSATEGRRCDAAFCRDGACRPADAGVDADVDANTGVDQAIADAPEDLGADQADMGGDSAPDTGVVPNNAFLLAHFTCDAFAEGAAQNAASDDHDGECVGGCPELRAGPVGQACFFDGTGQHLRVPTDEAFDLSEGVTVSFWTQPGRDVFSSLVAVPFGTDSSNSWQFDQPELGDGTRSRFIMRAAERNVAADGPAMARDEWVHLAGTWDRETLTLYVDGERFAATPGDDAGLWDGGDVLIGADRNAGVTIRGFLGGLDEVRVYSIALDAEAIRALAVR